MSINLTILQSFNNAVNSANRLNDNTRLQNESFNLNGKCKIRQIPANKYDHVANNAVRRNFAAALTGAFGVKSLADLPEGIRNSLKIGDFKLDKNGEITSTRPLTARRVRAVMSAIQEVTAKAAPTRQEAEAIRNDFNAYLKNSAYMKAAFDRIAIAERRKPLTLEIPFVSEKSFDLPLSALKVYTKGIKASDLAANIGEIKNRIESDVSQALLILAKMKAGETLAPDAKGAEALTRYFALCAVAADPTGRGVSRIISVPDTDGKIAAFLKSSLKGADDIDTGVKHMSADPFIEGSRAMTRFAIDIGFSESAGFSTAYAITYNAYEELAAHDGFSPLMRRGVEPRMSIAQMYSNITAENTRLLNAYSAEMDALFKAHPELSAAANGDTAAPVNFTNIPEPFKANIGKILSLRQTLNTFFSSLALNDPIYADNPALRYADETILTADNIPALREISIVNRADAGAAINADPAEPYEGLTFDDFLAQMVADAPADRKNQEDRFGWAVASLITEMPPARWGNRDFSGLNRNLGRGGVSAEAIDFLRTVDMRELYMLRLCKLCDASTTEMLFNNAGASVTRSVSIYKSLMSGEIPLGASLDFLKSLGATATMMNPNTADRIESCGTFEVFASKKWGFNTDDFAVMAKFIKDCGYDITTVTESELDKLMALARLRDYKLEGLVAFYHRVLHKDVRAIDENDLQRLYNLYTEGKLIDPLNAVKPGRTLDVIGVFTGDKLPSATGVAGKDMVEMISTLRRFAADGGAKEATLVFNGKTVVLDQRASGLLHITVDGVKVAGAQSAAGFVNIFEGDVASNVDRFGAGTVFKVMPGLTAGDIAELPGSTSHLREMCLRIVAGRLEIPASSFATVPTAMLRTIAANALKGYYTSETGRLDKAVANAVLSANVRNDVFTGEEIRDLHAAMVRTGVEELNRKVVVVNRPAPRPVNIFNPQARLAATQEKARNLLADLIMNADIVSYDEAMRKGEGGKRILDLLSRNLDTFVDIVINPGETLAGLAEPMRGVLVERFSEMTASLPSMAQASAIQKAAMKQVYKAAFTVMMEVASLPEADRAAAVLAKIDANKALKGAVLMKQASAEQLSEAILGMIPQIAGLDRAMDELVGTAMAQIQETINEKLSANMPDEADEAAPREEAPIWQQSFDRLVGGALTDSSCGYGKFMNEVLSRYFVNASPQEGRQMLASIFRNTDANSTPGQVVGALFKGAGPLLQKMLQALPADAFGDDMRDALKDMKSNLQPIPETIVKAHLLDIVSRSAGAIRSIELVRSLGAASVGQAFLCKIYTDEHPAGEEVVVKILRPNVKTIIENEHRRFVEAAKATPGMEKTFEGQYERILEELDFTKEKTNINFARNVYEKPVMIYTDGFSKASSRSVTMNRLHSMEVHPLVPPTMDSLILKKAPGETYDRFMANTREKAREILGGINLTENAQFADPGSLRAAEAKLITLYNDARTRQEYLLQLTEKWVQEAVYGNGFYHGDLHAGNIMTDGEGLTVIDFGNATHLTKVEREHVLRMMASAMYGRENFFENSFKALISEEGRAVYDAKNANGELTGELHEILNKGVTTDAGKRIFAALMCLQRHGIEIPGPIYNFAQCQMRLGGAVEEMSALMNELKLSISRLALAPIEVPEIPEGTQSVSVGVKDSIGALKRFLNREGAQSYTFLARELEAHFGTSRMGGRSDFDTTRLPALLAELQTAFADRATFDNCLLPFLERLCEAKTFNLHDVWNVEMYREKGDTLREKLAAFKAARDGGDAALEASAAEELANAFVMAVRTYNLAMSLNIPDRADDPDEGAFVYAIANVVNSNLRPALESLGAKAVSLYFDMRSAKAKEQAAAERIEGSLARVQAYVNAFAGGAVSVEAIKAIRRISENFQHPLEMPGMNGSAGSLKSNANRALFLTTLRFNLDHLENELRAEGLLTDETTAEMKTHFARIAMQFFADRVGGIADAVRRLSNSAYANLYDEAYAQEVNSPKLLVRDALVHFRFPAD